MGSAQVAGAGLGRLAREGRHVVVGVVVDIGAGGEGRRSRLVGVEAGMGRWSGARRRRGRGSVVVVGRRSLVVVEGRGYGLGEDIVVADCIGFGRSWVGVGVGRAVAGVEGVGSLAEGIGVRRKAGFEEGASCIGCGAAVGRSCCRRRRSSRYWTWWFVVKMCLSVCPSRT